MKKVMLMVILLAVAVMLAVPNTGKAEPFGKGKFQFSVGLRQMTLHVVDTVAVQLFLPPGFFWGAGNGAGIHDPKAMGLGAEFKFGLSDDWALNWGGAFAWANEKTEYDFGAAPYDINWKASGFSLSAGVDRTVNLSSMVGLYFGPGLEWTIAKSKAEQNDFIFAGSEDWDSKSTNAISLTGRVGVQAMLGTHFGIDANLGQKWTKVSFSEDVDDEELKINSWVSSMGGFAGFTFYLN